MSYREGVIAMAKDARCLLERSFGSVDRAINALLVGLVIGAVIEVAQWVLHAVR